MYSSSVKKPNKELKIDLLYLIFSVLQNSFRQTFPPKESLEAIDTF